MIVKLQKRNYTTVRKLYKRLEEFQPMCSAVLEGIYPGKIFVDDVDHPQTSLLTTYITSENDGVWGSWQEIHALID